MLTVLIILVIVLLILYIPIIVKVEVEDETKLTLFLFFIPIKIDLDKPQKEDTPEEKAKKHKKSKAKKKVKKEEELVVTEKGGKIDDILKVIRIIKKVIGDDRKPIVKLLGGIYIYNLILNMTVHGEDAAEVAINYGRITGVINYVLGAVSHFIKIKPKKIDIVPAFVEQEKIFKLSFYLRTTLAILIVVIAIIVTRVIKAVLDDGKPRNINIDIKNKEEE